MSERLDDRQFDLLGVAVAATLLAHVGHLPVWLSVPIAVLLPLRVWTRRRGAKPAPLWVRMPLTLALLALVFTSYRTVFGQEPGTVLGCGLLALKLLESERARDARVALAFAAFVLMSALLFTQSLAFTLLVCATLLLLLAALAALQPAPLGRRPWFGAELRLAARLLGTALPLAAAAFVLVPRLGSPLWGSPGADTAGRTGLDERMAPGELTELLTDDSPAFRVEFDGAAPPPQRRYFRAIVLWDFDGAAWSRRPWYGRGRPENAQAEGDEVGYTVTLEPSDRVWLPALDLPLDAPPGAALRADRVVVADHPVTKPREYHVRSAQRYVLAPTLNELERRRALALPAGFNPQARALAEGWRAERRDDAAVIAAALEMFHASFTYSLSVPALGHDSIDEFLFGTRRGFCEHYASAFVFLMRAAGIPARVVTGYQGGWWNASDAYLLVRQSDAHAWAEVWLDGRGWQRVDPTAAVSPSRIELGAAAANGSANWTQASWLRALRDRFDFVNRLWTRGVIRFDALRQRSLLSPFGVADANPGDLLLALSAVLALAMVAATIWAMRAAPHAAGDALDRAWAKLGRRLARRGFAARPSEGPLDWLKRLRDDADAPSAALAPLVGEYVALRYGTGTPPPARVGAFARAVRRLRLRRIVKAPR
ncbi:MAG TPA: DUF3488 and transglutaminase-like domain-containing protein [Dokdonella sp.]